MDVSTVITAVSACVLRFGSLRFRAALRPEINPVAIALMHRMEKCVPDLIGQSFSDLPSVPASIRVRARYGPT